MDPISMNLTQTALQNVNTGSSPLPSQGAGTFQTDKSNFANLLDSTLGAQNNANQASNAKLLDFVESFGADSTGGGGMKSLPGGEIQVDVARAGEIEKASAPKQTGILDMFKEVNTNQMNMEQMMESFFSGSKKSFTALELTRMQMYAHTCTVNMEVVSKVGEMANKAISTPFNMQVG
jgi:hypothetical protein